jgi:putative membrane protein
MPAELPILAALIATVLGALLGCLTGLVPGMHSNNLAAALSALPVALLAALGGAAIDGGGALTVCCAIVSCAVAHALASAVPSIFVGAPEGDDVASVLPGHRLLRAGRGGEALQLSVVSSLGAIALSLAILLPVRALMAPPLMLYRRSLPWLGPALLLVSGLLVIGEATRAPQRRRRLSGWRAGAMAMILLLASGLLGYLVVFRNGALLGGGSVGGAGIGALFVGLFGLPTVAWAMLDPPRSEVVGDVAGTGAEGRGCWGAVLRGVLAGAVVGWFPGTSSGQATMVAVAGKGGPTGGDELERARRYVAGAAAVAAASTVFNLAALATFMRIRSGPAAAVARLTGWAEAPWDEGWLPGPDVALLLVAIAVGAAVAAMVTVSTGRLAAERASSLGGRRLLAAVAIVLVGGCVALGGDRSALVLLAATSLGLLPPMLGIMRVHLMGAMTLPVALGLMLR